MAMKIVDLPIISMVIIQLIIDILVGGLEPCNFITFQKQLGNVIIPTDFHSIIFQRGRSYHQPDNDI